MSTYVHLGPWFTHDLPGFQTLMNQSSADLLQFRDRWKSRQIRKSRMALFVK